MTAPARVGQDGVVRSGRPGRFERVGRSRRERDRRGRLTSAGRLRRRAMTPLSFADRRSRRQSRSLSARFAWLPPRRAGAAFTAAEPARGSDLRSPVLSEMLVTEGGAFHAQAHGGRALQPSGSVLAKELPHRVHTQDSLGVIGCVLSRHWSQWRTPQLAARNAAPPAAVTIGNIETRSTGIGARLIRFRTPSLAVGMSAAIGRGARAWGGAGGRARRRGAAYGAGVTPGWCRDGSS